MPGIFDDAELTLPCGKCGHQFQEKVARLKTSPSIPCPKCGVVTHYNADDFRQKLGAVDNAVEELRRKIRGFGKS